MENDCALARCRVGPRLAWPFRWQWSGYTRALLKNSGALAKPYIFQGREGAGKLSLAASTE